MAVRTWKGGTSAVAQVWKTTVANAVNTDTYQITMTDEGGNTGTITYTATVPSDTTTTIAAGLAALITASTDPRFKAVTALASTASITLTAVAAGVPFYAATGGTGSFSSTGNTTANQGPNDFNTASNWRESAVPLANDDMILDGSNSLLYGLTTGLSLHGITSLASYSGQVGASGLYFTAICTSLTWNGTGTSYVNISTSAIAPTINNTAGAVSPASGLYLLGSAMTTLSIYGGSVDIAGAAGRTATVTTVLLSGNSARVNIGTGGTITNLDVENGTATSWPNLSTVIMNGGNMTTYGTGTVGTGTVNSGTMTSNSTGTITTLNVYGGVVDFTQSPIARTVTTLNMYPARGAQVKLDTNYITLTNKITLSGGPTAVTAA